MSTVEIVNYSAHGDTSCGVSVGITGAKICDLNTPVHSSVHPKSLLQFLVINVTSYFLTAQAVT
jgi:hypothetical protein